MPEVARDTRGASVGEPPPAGGRGQGAAGRPGAGVRNLLARAIPGSGPLLAGRVGEGMVALVAAAVLAGSAVAGAPRAAAAIADGSRWLVAGDAAATAAWAGVRGDALFAVVVLASAIVGLWTWAAHDATGGRGPSRDTEARRVWRQFRRNRGATGGLLVISFLYLFAALTPLLAPHAPDLITDPVANKHLPPLSPGFLLGTDEFSRDVLSRLMYGARISLSIGFVAAGLSVTLGTAFGAIAAWFGGWIDLVVMRVVDMLLAFPGLVLLLFVVATFETRSLFLIVTVFGLTGWMHVARLVRAEVLSLKERDFVQAARALGLRDARILLVHLIPNALAPVIVAGSLITGSTLLLDAGLSFLGLGVSPPTPTWGGMIAEGRMHLRTAPWVAIPPGLAIMLAVLSLNLVGDGLRDALDPRLRDGR